MYFFNLIHIHFYIIHNYFIIYKFDNYFNKVNIPILKANYQNNFQGICNFLKII